MRARQTRPQQSQKGSATTSGRRTALTAAREPGGDLEAIQIAANSYCLSHYGVGYSGGLPQRLILRVADVWIVPALLTSPGYGVVGEVGVVAVDAATNEIVGATPHEEVRAAGARLAQEKEDELKAAFRRARKT